MVIRQAKLSEIERLKECEQGVVSAERPFDPTIRKEVVSYYNLKEMILDNDCELLVAVINDNIVGTGYARIKDARLYLDHKKYAYLGFMFVDKAFRGQGINNAIVEKLKLWCLSKNLIELRLDVYSNNEAAINAYKKVGFSNNMIGMRMRLKEEEV